MISKSENETKIVSAYSTKEHTQPGAVSTGTGMAILTTAGSGADASPTSPDS
jgi:hypothetical protein